MLDFSWSHILIVLVVAVVVIGPKDLPRVMRMAGRWASRARSIMSHLRKELLDVSQQAELDELRKDVAALKHSPVAQSRATSPVAAAQNTAQASSQPLPAVGSGAKVGE